MAFLRSSIEPMLADRGFRRVKRHFVNVGKEDAATIWFDARKLRGIPALAVSVGVTITLTEIASEVQRMLPEREIDVEYSTPVMTTLGYLRPEHEWRELQYRTGDDERRRSEWLAELSMWVLPFVDANRGLDGVAAYIESQNFSVPAAEYVYPLILWRRSQREAALAFAHRRLGEATDLALVTGRPRDVKLAHTYSAFVERLEARPS